MKRSPERNVNTFNRDVRANQGYIYTTNVRLSSITANNRLSDIALNFVSFQAKRVLDIGCGDGTYSLELYDRGQPAYLRGVDPAQDAITIASQKVQGRSAEFSVDNAYQLNIPDDSYDLAHVRGVLHHMDYPQQAIGEVLRVARQALIIEPNGYNPILKLLEKISPYHREHDEKSYFPRQLDRWIELSGGVVVKRAYAGIVPFFAPDWYVHMAKPLEPLVEALPLMKQISCAVYVVLVVRS